MNIIEQYQEISNKYSEMSKFLMARARIKSEASYELNDEYRNKVIQNGNLYELSIYEEGIWVEFQYYSRGSSDEYSIYLELEEIEMSDEDFNTHIQNEFANTLRARETRARIELADAKRRYLETLAGLQEKYGKGYKWISM